MKFSVFVKPNSKTPSVEQTGQNTFQVRVDAPSRNNKANERLIVLMSEYFGVPKSRIEIIKGKTGRKKIVEIT